MAQLTISFLAMLVLYAGPAFADAPLIYKLAATGLQERRVISFLQETGNIDPRQNYKIASADLNNDGVAEWVVQTGGEYCAATASCQFFILGLREHEPAILGVFRAGKIAISPDKRYGVRRLMVYNQRNNDYVSQFYDWSPVAQAYVPHNPDFAHQAK